MAVNESNVDLDFYYQMFLNPIFRTLEKLGFHVPGMKNGKYQVRSRLASTTDADEGVAAAPVIDITGDDDEDNDFVGIV